MANAVRKLASFTIDLHRAVANAMMKGVATGIRGVKKGLQYIGTMAKKLLSLVNLHIHKLFKLGTMKMGITKTFKLDEYKNERTSGWTTTNESSVSINGSVNFSPSVRLDIDIVKAVPKKFGIELSASFGAAIRTTVSIVNKLSKEDTQLLYTSPGVIIPVFPGIFFTLSPSLNGVVGVEFSAASTMSLIASVQSVKPIITGVMWELGRPLRFNKQAPTFNKTFSTGHEDDKFLEVTKLAGAYEYESLIQFPLSSIPSSAKISSAKLMLYGVGAFYADETTVRVRKILGDWNESVQWNSKPRYDSKDVTNSTLRSVRAWHEFDITSVVEEWHKGTSNYGVSLIANYKRPMDNSAFFSGDNLDSEHRPKLVIEYY